MEGKKLFLGDYYFVILLARKHAVIPLIIFPHLFLNMLDDLGQGSIIGNIKVLKLKP